MKFLQIMHINKDQQMCYQELNKITQACTSKLNWELGQDDCILFNNIVTLTYNLMEVLKCHIVGISYGRVMVNVERAIT